MSCCCPSLMTSLSLSFHNSPVVETSIWFTNSCKMPVNASLNVAGSCSCTARTQCWQHKQRKQICFEQQNVHDQRTIKLHMTVFYRWTLRKRGIRCRHGSTSVHLSVCLSQVGILLKWLNVTQMLAYSISEFAFAKLTFKQIMQRLYCVPQTIFKQKNHFTGVALVSTSVPWSYRCQRWRRLLIGCDTNETIYYAPLLLRASMLEPFIVVNGA